jgi:hypothetical protein
MQVYIVVDSEFSSSNPKEHNHGCFHFEHRICAWKGSYTEDLCYIPSSTLLFARNQPILEPSMTVLV